MNFFGDFSHCPGPCREPCLLAHRRDHGDIALLHLVIRSVDWVLQIPGRSGMPSRMAATLKNARWRLKAREPDGSLSHAAEYLAAGCSVAHEPQLSTTGHRLCWKLEDRRFPRPGAIARARRGSPSTAVRTSVITGVLTSMGFVGKKHMHWQVQQRLSITSLIALDIRRLAQERQASLIVTVDCGISAIMRVRLSTSWELS